MREVTPESGILNRALQIVAITTFVLALGAICVYLAFDTSAEDMRKAAHAIEKECSESGGVLIRGSTESSIEATKFSVCVPAEAFTCIDVE